MSVCRLHRLPKVDAGARQESSDGLDPGPTSRFPSASTDPYDVGDKGLGDPAVTSIAPLDDD